jgi:hypothetical protein
MENVTENNLKEALKDIENDQDNKNTKIGDYEIITDNINTEYDKMSISDFLEKEEGKEKPKPKKVDRRKTSSRINIAKARQAKQRKAQERKRQLKELFGSDSESTESASEESEDSDDNYTHRYHKYKYQSHSRKQQREIDELRQLVFKLASKDKKRRRKKKKEKKEDKPQPVIHYNIEAPKFDKEEVKKPREMNSVFTNYIKNKIKNK